MDRDISFFSESDQLLYNTLTNDIACELELNGIAFEVYTEPVVMKNGENSGPVIGWGDLGFQLCYEKFSSSSNSPFILFEQRFDTKKKRLIPPLSCPLNLQAHLHTIEQKKLVHNILSSYLEIKWQEPFTRDIKVIIIKSSK